MANTIKTLVNGRANAEQLMADGRAELAYEANELARNRFMHAYMSTNRDMTRTEVIEWNKTEAQAFKLLRILSV